jgi:hypothetical protein
MRTLDAASRVVLLGAENAFAADVIDSVGRHGARIEAIVLIGEAEWDLRGRCVLLPENIQEQLLSHDCFVPRNNPGLRKVRVLKAQEFGFRSFLSIVDPTAVVSPAAALGSGVFVNAGAVMGAYVEVFDHVFVNRLAGIGHHSILEEFVSIGPGAAIASRVRIGRGTMVGAGASIAPDLTIGSNSLVAVGAVVHKDIPSNVVVAGNPARIVKSGIEGPRGYGV